MARRTEAQLLVTRTSLLVAAEQLFAEQGYANTQIAEIARAAGVGISSFYRQFDDKEQLLVVVLTQLFTALRHELVETRAGIELRSPLEQLTTVRQTYEAVFRAFFDRPNVTRVMLQSGSGASGAVRALIQSGVDALVEDMAEDLSRAQLHGLLTIPDKRLFADALVGMCMQVARRMLSEGTASPAAATQLCTRMTLGAMVPYMCAEVAEVVVPLIVRLPAAQKGGV